VSSGFGCEHRAKSSTFFTTIPDAEAIGRCEMRAESYDSDPARVFYGGREI